MTLEDMEALRKENENLSLEVNELNVVLNTVQAGSRALREALEYVFERARLARFNVYDNRDDAYEYLVQIREKEAAMKKEEAMLSGSLDK